MKIESIKEAEQALQKYVPNVSKFIGDGMSLDRMWKLLEIFDNPQEDLKIIHVAGTSGKTSTSYYIASILQNSGKKVGLTISPHIDSITERFQINGHNIPNEIFCSDLGEFLSRLEKAKLNPSYFELLIAFVFWSSKKNKLDYLVLETGMGGLLDATNVVTRTDKVCCITDIGYDHMHILGNTLSEISEQKAGIIQKNNAVFMYEQSSKVMQSIKERVALKSATLNVFKLEELFKITKLNISEVAKFQKRNWLLAEKVCEYVASRDNFVLNYPDANKIIVPGRIERVNLNGETLIFDGAHNQQKMKVFVDSFKALYPNKKANILIALKEGKEYKQVINELRDICKAMIVTTFNTSQDLPAVSLDPEIIKQFAQTLGLNCVSIPNLNDAIKILLTNKANLKLVTGSFYLIGQIRMSLNDIDNEYELQKN